jgi:hypothetical protein
MAVLNKESISKFERQIIERIGVLIDQKYKSVREFANKAGISYFTLNGILAYKQHLNFSHFEKILKGLDGDFISVFSEAEYVKKSEVPDLSEEEQELLENMKRDERVRDAVMGEFRRISAYVNRETHVRELPDFVLEILKDDNLSQLFEYIVNIGKVREYLESQFSLARKVFKDQISQYETEKEKENGLQEDVG